MSTLSTAKFLKILSTFSESEIKAFENWLKSPWANSNKNLVRILEKLIKYHPDFNHRLLTKERLFKQVLPNGKYSDRRMNNLLSEAYLSAERFLIFQNLSKDENLQKDLLTKELQNRHLEDWFFKTANQEIDRLDEKPIKDWEDHVALLQLHRRVYHHPNQNPRMQPGGKTIVEMGEQVDLVYLLEKAAIINEKIFRNRILKNENHDTETELRKWHIASEGFEHAVLDFYRMRFGYTEENRLEQYYKLRKAFLSRFEELNSLDQKMHLLWLLNDTAYLARKKKLNNYENLHLYKLGLRKKLLLTNDKLTHVTFLNIVMSSNSNGDFQFTKNFISNFTKKLNEQYQSDGKNWAMSHTFYREKKLEESLNILLKNKFNSIFFLRLSKVLTCQVYFDLFLEDTSYQFYLLNFLDSFEKWLTRDKVQAKKKYITYIRFVQTCRTILKEFVNPIFDKEKVENLLELKYPIQAPNWLSNKINKVVQIKSKATLK